ncbi:hypothetical protein LDJ79_08335 [Vibrio tritonius]|uniref:Capsular biosynthesis protein n=1 Tax=Vibrio tritonius TaxID=1435069 RepID=A0ABS7YPD3_9VIBR|nr:hypothetical protein [Vibrio tritonius]MCA2016115.1 hypothetical protein [Vibrio tritonius]
MEGNISIVIIDYSFSTSFFIRLANSDRKRKYIFIVTSISSFYKVKASGYEVYLISRFSRKSDICFPKESYINAKEIKLRIMNECDVYNIFSKILNLISKILSSQYHENFNLLVWSGAGVSGEVVRFVKGYYENLNISTGFFEISNLPGKIFVDCLGTNAQSSIYLSKCKQLKYIDDEINNDYLNWLDICKKSKLGVYTPPQANLGKKLNIFHFFDFLFSISLGYRLFSFDSVLKKLPIKNKKNGITFDEKLPQEYVFFPMQVSSDAQLILNSDLDNRTALNLILKEFKGNVVIKPHPAERNVKYIFDIIDSNKDRVFFTNGNTYELIVKSSKILTINSTVGLEGLIFGKDVKFYGHSFYSYFDDNIMKNYIMNLLIDIDFFNTNLALCINEKEIDKIYSLVR